MVHSLAPAAAAVTPISARPNRKIQSPSRVAVSVTTARANDQSCNVAVNDRVVQRRNVTLGLAGALLGLSIGKQDASAAARRPPPPPAEEKKDPNVSGVLAKVLASKKRKEAMKEAIAKLREKGKIVNDSPE